MSGRGSWDVPNVCNSPVDLSVQDTNITYPPYSTLIASDQWYSSRSPYPANYSMESPIRTYHDLQPNTNNSTCSPAKLSYSALLHDECLGCQEKTKEILSLNHQLSMLQQQIEELEEGKECMMKL